MKINKLFESGDDGIIGATVFADSGTWGTKSGSFIYSKSYVNEYGTGNRRWVGDMTIHDVSKNCKSLKHSPREVGGHFVCSNLDIETLDGGPEFVGSSYNCSKTKISNLKGLPKVVNSFLYCSQNHNLTSLEGAPEIIKGTFYLVNCSNLTSLKDIRKYVKSAVDINLDKTPLKSHILGLLLIEKLNYVCLDSSLDKVESIVNKYLGHPYTHQRMYECQDELIEAGFEEYAQL